MGREAEQIACTPIEDLEKLYKTPESVLADNRLTQEQKDGILHCWEQDQLALIRAEEENMTPKTNAPSATEALEKIKEAERVLQNALKEGNAA